MFNYLIKFVLLCALSISLHAQSGLSQKHLISVIPEVSSQDISTDSTIEIKFDLPITKKSVKKNTITLRSENKDIKSIKIDGITTIKNETTLLFTPSEALKSGTYNVKVKKIKLLDYSINTKFKRFAKKMCSYFYDDVKDCRLYRYASSVKTKKINYSFSVDDTSAKILSIKLNKSNIQLNENNQTTINVNAFYDDNTTLDVTEDVKWIMGNNSIISISKNIIKPLAEGITTLQAKYNTQKSSEIEVSVYKEINGYKLPPEPDPAVNNSTMLGIDSNDNGVRDDVERKIIETYQEPIKIELMMSTAKVGQEILENPIGLAHEHSKKMDKLDNCGMYLDSLNISFDILQSVDFYENNVYNTKVRVKAYLDYNQELSGGVYGSSPSDWNAQACDFNVEQMLQDIK